MGSMGSGGVLSLTEGEFGQRTGSSGSGWGASAGEIWKQEGGHSQRKEGYTRAPCSKVKVVE